jgi:hypothetical protein
MVISEKTAVRERLPNFHFILLSITVIYQKNYIVSLNQINMNSGRLNYAT